MKNFILPFIAFLFITLQLNAATYYLTTANQSAAQTLANWNTTGTGGGTTHPSNFTTSGDVFIISSGQAAGFAGSTTFAAGVTLQCIGTLTISGANTSLTINGTVTFSSTNTTQVSLNGDGSGNSFVLSSGAYLKTVNTNGIQGTNCSLPTNASKKTVTLNAAANYEFNGSTAQVTLGLPATVGALTISNAAGVTLGSTITIGGAFTINSGAAFSTSGIAITLNGDFNNSGTFNAGASNISIGGTVAQGIDGFTTTGTVSMTKTAGTATFHGNVNAGSLTINGSGGTLDLGTGLTHTISGNWTRTNGTLLGNSSLLQIGGSVSGSAGTFTPGTGTVSWNAAGAQTIAGVTYNNLTLAGSGVKTAGGNIVVNATLTIPAGFTLDMSTYTLTGTLATVANNGIIKTSSTTNPPLASSKNWGSVGTVEYAVLGGGQYIPAGTFFNLQLDNTSGNNTVLGSLTVNGNLNGGSSSGLIMNTNLSLSFANTTGNQCGPISFSTVNLTLTYAGNGTLNCGTITYGSSGTIINISGNGTIVCSGNLAFPASSGNQINCGSGTFTCSGTIGNASCSTSSISCTSGTITCLNITLGSSTSVTCGSGSIFINGAFTYGSSFTFTPGTGTINYSGSGAQTVLPLTNYNNLTVSGSGAKTLTSSSTVNGILSMEGTATVSASPTFGSAATLQYKGTGDFVTTSNEFPNSFTPTGGVIIDQGSHTVTLNANKTISGNLNIKSGTLDLTTYTANRTSAGGILTVAGKLKLSGASNFPTNYSTMTMTGGTIEYAASGNQTVLSAPAYNNLTISGSGTKTLGGATTIGGTLLINSGATLSTDAVNNYALIFQGDFTNNGTFNAGSSPITITGTASNQNISGFTTTGLFSFTKTAGTAVLLGNVTSGGLYVNGDGGTLDFGDGLTHSFNGNETIIAGDVDRGTSTSHVKGNINNNGHNNKGHGKIVLSNGNSKHSISGTGAFGDIELNDVYGAQVLSDITVNTLTITNGNFEAVSHTITIVDTGLAWNNTNHSFVYGNSTIRMQGTSAQSMFGSTFYNLEINNPAGVILTSSDTVTNQLILTSGNLTLGNYNLVIASPGSISGASSSKYIITNGLGSLIQNVGTTPVKFPVSCVASDTTPITFSNETAQYYNVRVRSITPNIAATGLARQWVIQETTPSTSKFKSLVLAWTTTSMGTLGAPDSCDIVANTTGLTNSYDPIRKGLSGNTFSVTYSPMDYWFSDIHNNLLYMTVVGKNSALPVELSSFTSELIGRNVRLNWETKSEKNSNKFVVEKQSGISWVAVGSVKAADLSNSIKQYSFIDKNLQTGKYQYRLKMIDNDGSFEYSKIIEATVTLPKNFELSQNYPNPFNPSTKIDYQIPVDAKVLLEVYNIVGQRVAVIVNEEQSAGYYSVNFNASSYRNLTSGVYIYKLTSEDIAGKNASSIKKMMLLK